MQVPWLRAPQNRDLPLGKQMGCPHVPAVLGLKILTTAQNLYMFIQSTGTEEEAKVVHKEFTPPHRKVRN